LPEFKKEAMRSFVEVASFCTIKDKELFVCATKYPTETEAPPVATMRLPIGTGKEGVLVTPTLAVKLEEKAERAVQKISFVPDFSRIIILMGD
jgi:hypothetical protein